MELMGCFPELRASVEQIQRISIARQIVLGTGPKAKHGDSPLHNWREGKYTDSQDLDGEAVHKCPRQVVYLIIVIFSVADVPSVSCTLHR